MVTRVLFLIRTLLTQSVWYSNRTQRVCNLYACEANYMFVIKSLMRYTWFHLYPKRTQPYEVIFSAMIAMIFIFGYTVRICESPLIRN
jgi:potassium intermediate/small conductance calcium-activated channel subfamily N protein 2